MQPLPDPSARIVITKHAGLRLHERAPDFTLDHARAEIVEALLSKRIEHRARNIFTVWTCHRERTYVLARERKGRATVVLTVLLPLAEAA